MADSLTMVLKPGPGPTDDADLILVERYARGETVAFDAIVRRHQSRVASLAHRLLGWPEDVDDVVQEVFLAALRGLSDFHGRSSLATWLTRITINKCRSYRRRQLLSPARWLAERLARDGPGDTPETAPPADQPAMNREDGERVRRAIGGLPAQYREVVILRYLEQMSLQEAGEILSVPPGTLQVRLHRARKLLRHSLADLVKE